MEGKIFSRILTFSEPILRLGYQQQTKWKVRQNKLKYINMYRKYFICTSCNDGGIYKEKDTQMCPNNLNYVYIVPRPRCIWKEYRIA